MPGQSLKVREFRRPLVGRGRTHLETRKWKVGRPGVPEESEIGAPHVPIPKRRRGGGSEGLRIKRTPRRRSPPSRNS